MYLLLESLSREITAHQDLLAIRLRCGLGHYAVALTASHPSGVLPLRRVLAWWLLGGILPRDNHHILFFILDGDNLTQSLPGWVLISVGQPGLVDGQMMQVFVFLRNK
jgi:hypothetical protein